MTPPSARAKKRAEKACTKCAVIQPMSNFYLKSDHLDGHRNMCKPCTRADARNWSKGRNRRPGYRESHAEYLRRRRAAGHLREKDRRDWMRTRQRHPERRHAYTLLREALRRGEIRRPAHCSECGKRPRPNPRGWKTIHAHHHRGYKHPLDVQWLCQACHSAAHARAMAEEE